MKLKVFIPYTENPAAQIQLIKIWNALKEAGYRLKNDIRYAGVWHIQGRSPEQAYTLTYDGFGRSLGEWWKLPAIMPAAIFNILQMAIGDGTTIQPFSLETEIQTLDRFQCWLESKQEGESIGFARHPCSCPLAIFLIGQVGDRVEVDRETITVGDRAYPNSPLVKEFVGQIDLDNSPGNITVRTARKALDVARKALDVQP